MKRLLLTFLVTILCTVLFSQDLLIKRNGEQLKVKIVEVLPKEIKFKLFDYLDGPPITMNKSEVHKIIYANGTEQLFTSMKAPHADKYTSRREPGLAAIFSIIYPGVGQFYNKEYYKTGIIGGTATIGFIAAIVGYDDDYVGAIGVSIYGIFWLWSVIDAPISAGAINRRYNLANGSILNNNKFNIKINPYFTAFNTGSFNNNSFAYGARLCLNLK